jgi:hypothetical protein
MTTSVHPITMRYCPKCSGAKQYRRVDDTVIIFDKDGNRHTFGIKWGRSQCHICGGDWDAGDLREG